MLVRSRLCSFLVVVLTVTGTAWSQEATTKLNLAKRPWPAEVARVQIPVSDGTKQSSMWYTPGKGEKKPLLVALHTWSSTFASAGGDAVYAEWCIKSGWAFLHPDFRGPNSTPQGMGSDRAVKDIVEAVAWAKKETSVDESRVYLIGVSGGGHMALLMAGRHPEQWTAVSAWCGISDIAQWHADHMKNGAPGKYAQDIEKALGGDPTSKASLMKEAEQRSPNTWLKAARSLPLDISAGVHDGRSGSVPFTHSLHAYNAVVGAGKAALDKGKIEEYYKTRKLPSGWTSAGEDASYGAWKPLFRHTDGATRVTIFEGGHEIVHQAAMNWLAQQRRGQPPVWEIKDLIKLEVGGGESGL